MHTGKGDAMRYATKHIIRSLLDANCKPRLCVIIQHHGDDILHKLRHTQVLKHEARRAKKRSSHRHQRVLLTSCDHKRLDRITIPSLHHFVVCIRRFATAAGHRHGRSLRKRWRFNAGRAPWQHLGASEWQPRVARYHLPEPLQVNDGLTCLRNNLACNASRAIAAL